MTRLMPPVSTPLRRVLACERGAARTQAVFAIVLLVWVVSGSAYLLARGGAPAPARAIATPEAVALAELTDRRIRQFGDVQVQERLDRYLDRNQRTDAQLRNAHRIWARRVNNPDFGDPDLAADMLAITETALRLRGVQPHGDI